MLQFLTRTGALTGVMPRLYVSCHPDDFERLFRTICADIFAVQENCAVFYEDDPSAEYNENELFSLLSEMRLIVVPVTRRLLSESSRSLDIELPFAKRNSIAILPILAEDGDATELIDLFNNTEVFRGLQFLNRYDRDPTALKYEDKLSTLLRSVLITEEEVQRIHNEFSSKIFLSYRKKDREQAQELMRRIHRVDVCRDTAIWYDEYLIPGEAFDTNIMEALDESDVFVMSVTSSFREPGNYVADHEYPDAVRKGKPLVAADMKHFDRDTLDDLEVLYPGINALMVDPDDTDALGVTLRRRLIEEAGISEDRLLDDDGEHLYYIALAYKNGIRTEADPARAAEIFRMSADNGCYESYLRLIGMYRMGDGVPKDPEAALECCKKAEETLRPLEGSSLRSDNALAEIYEEEGHIYSALKDEEKMAAAFLSALELRKKMQKMYEDASLGKYCESMITFASVLYESGLFTDAGDLAAGFIAENGLLLEGGETTGGDAGDDLGLLRIKARVYSLLCGILLQLKRLPDVTRYAKARVEVCERIENATGDVEDLRDLADAYLVYADFLKNTDTALADRFIEKYTEIRSRLDEFEQDRPKTVSDAIDTLSIADNALMKMYSGDASSLERATALYNEVLGICSGLMEGSGRYNATLLTAEVYQRFGEIERAVKGSGQKSMENYKRALSILKDAEKEHRNDYRIMVKISGVLDRIGTLYMKNADLTNATQCYTDALEIDMRLSRLLKDSPSRHNLAKSYMRCAEINKERGHQPVADVNNRSALKILEQLVQETDDYRIIEDLALANFRLGMSERFPAEKRLDYYSKALHVYEHLLTITNNAAQYISARDAVQQHMKGVS